MKVEPPYLRIATALRERIASGALAPGDKMPSNRDVAAEFEVALATATRALALLRDEGTIVVRPRSGAVVAWGTPAPARRARARTLDERIVFEAMTLADEEGLDALSMRAVATRLGVATMGLYRYVANKEELVAKMSDAAFAEVTLPERPAEWRVALETIARTQWQLYERHPWLAHTMSLARPLPLPRALAHAEWIFAALDSLGLDAPTMLHIHVAIFAYVRGIAVDLAPEARARAETGIDDGAWMQAQEERFAAVANDAELPTFARVTAELSRPGSGFDFHLKGAFEFGLGPLLDGLGGVIERTRRR